MSRPERPQLKMGTWLSASRGTPGGGGGGTKRKLDSLILTYRSMFTELFFHEYYMIEKYEERFSIVNREIVNRSLCLYNIGIFVIL